MTPPESYTEGPTLAELNRRVQRLENITDARIVTVDVYTADKAGRTIELAALSQRIGDLEDSVRSATRLLLGAFLAILGNALFLALQTFGKG